MTFDPLRNGRSNRDRRDATFARSVIAEAERRRQAVKFLEVTQVIEDTAEDHAEPDRCPMCNDALSGNCEIRDEHFLYCSARCAIESENDNAHD